MSNKQGIIFDDGVLYRHGENGSSEWLEDGDEKKDGRYIGEIDNGEPNGQGAITYSDGGMYVGEWENGKYHGHGTFTYPDRTRYKWEYLHMYEQDQKIPIFCLLNKYAGDWKDGEKHGQGTYYFSWGGKLVGEFKENKPWNVTEYDKDGNILERWVNGEMESNKV